MKKATIFILLVIIGSILTTAAWYFGQTRNTGNVKIACTMEAKLCPGGTEVGRVGPNCEFAKCPFVELSGIKGIALLGPMCPVQKIPPDPNCADRPYKTELVATLAGQSGDTTQFSSGSDGKFVVDLLPGDYTIGSADTAGMFSHCKSQGAITVNKNEYTNITLNCDTGIR